MISNPVVAKACETSGGCSVVSRKTDMHKPFENLRTKHEMQKAIERGKEYERIMNIPAEKRTFAEKMLVAEVEAGKVIDFIDKLKPQVVYMA